MDKKTIAVIFGGCSTEYEVSLQSACSVLANLDAEKYEAVKIGITRQGDWYRYNGGIAQIQNDSWHRDGGNLTPAAVSQSRTRPGLLELRPEGITKISREAELKPALRLALEHDDKVVIEEGIDGFEVGCAVLGTKELLVGRVDEIELTDGFFDYTEKYTLKTSSIHMPARISREDEKRIQEAAKTIYRTLECSGFARVDMFLNGAGEIVFNEVNTIPGFTAHSRYPKGKEEVTGIGHEPWHFRYVGYPHSEIMSRHGFTLEEYMTFIRQYSPGSPLRWMKGSRLAEIFFIQADKQGMTEIAPGDL